MTTAISRRAVWLVLAATAGFTRAYAVPLSLLGFGLTRWVAFHRVRHLAYAPEPRSEFSR